MSRVKAPEGHELIRVVRTGSGAGFRFEPSIPADRAGKLLARVGGHWIAVKHLPITFTLSDTHFLAVPARRKP